MRLRAANIAIGFALLAAVVSIGPSAWRATAKVSDVNADVLETFGNTPIGQWTPTQAAGPVVDASPLDAEGKPLNVYDHVVYRNYERPDGTIITLVLAYLGQQQVRSGIHRPEGCYTSLGYMLSHAQDITIDPTGRAIRLRAFTATSVTREESVAYWVRNAGTLSRSPIMGRLEAIRTLASHHVPDAIVVRASIARSRIGGRNLPSDSAQVLAKFLSDFVASTPQAVRPILIG